MLFTNAYFSALGEDFSNISRYKAFLNSSKLKSGICLSKKFLSLYVLFKGCHRRGFFPKSQDSNKLKMFE